MIKKSILPLIIGIKSWSRIYLEGLYVCSFWKQFEREKAVMHFIATLFIYNFFYKNIIERKILFANYKIIWKNKNSKENVKD